jgi:ABC-type maltose transport system permease subunit
MPGYPTLAYGLYYLCNVPRDEIDASIPMQLAGCMLMALPLLALFMAGHKKLLGNVSLGGLK